MYVSNQQIKPHPTPLKLLTLSNVVLPAPRKPHNKVTGKRLFSHESISKFKNYCTDALLYVLYFEKIS